MPERAQTSFGENDPVGIGYLRFMSCHALQLFPTEFRVVDPHAMQQNGQLSSHSNDNTASALGTHQTHSPRLDLRLRHTPHEQRIARHIKCNADITVPSL